ncbi:MAG: RagB/SusD family nutrient uptake outer membrane protein [Candidatus Pseudobacter hemicellulosilyticus]|uniref:RagB/SusD family nutrient uptake outer membrane protein n=1 Tax=Candidatus Pseudobacter hemicellulosilyticus TaxID=3121375 RepID=A0AAJ5WQT6_9BACT|nr:MAG: RagB/SusD family nutrient uptake outer membrane protein [Pseudobacter sp.]
MKINITFLFSIATLMAVSSCGKKYLDYKPDQRQVVPQKLDDFQALLDNTTVMNEQSSTNLGLIGGDEYYVTEAQYNGIVTSTTNDFQKNAYIWADQVFQGREPVQIDWTAGYNHIMLANLALGKTADSGPEAGEQEKWNLLKGNALFFRALNFYQLAQLHCPVYNAATAREDLGLPLRLDADPTIKMARSSVEDTYLRIIADLTAAEGLLPDNPVVFFRPGKAAVYALLTRVYMQQGLYDKALDYANKCLQLNSRLTDFNTLSFTGNFTFPAQGNNNVEVIFMNNAYGFIIVSSTATGGSTFNADSALLKSYTPGDLRYNAYWTQSGARTVFKGSYKGTAAYFTGFATDEVYLNRAECLARTSQPAAALTDLNTLRQHRFTPGSYVELNSSDEQQVLDWVIAERRKELVVRGTRWEDLRRLNKEPRYATAIVRQLGATRYELKPGDVKWTWPLPVEAIQNGGYEQNLR